MAPNWSVVRILLLFIHTIKTVLKYLRIGINVSVADLCSLHDDYQSGPYKNVVVIMMSALWTFFFHFRRKILCEFQNLLIVYIMKFTLGWFKSAKQTVYPSYGSLLELLLDWEPTRTRLDFLQKKMGKSPQRKVTFLSEAYANYIGIRQCVKIIQDTE